MERIRLRQNRTHRQPLVEKMHLFFFLEHSAKYCIAKVGETFSVFHVFNFVLGVCLI